MKTRGQYLCAMNLKTFTTVIVILLLILPEITAAQISPEYPPDGVYTSFSSFRNGLPDLQKSRMIRSATGDTNFTIRQWVNSEKLYFLDHDSVKKSFERKDFWSYVENGILFIHLGYKFHKVTLLGQISYFLESYPVIKGNMAPVVTDTKAASVYRLLDMETGDIMDYNIPNLEELLARDENLLTEFKAIDKPKTKKKKMYSFVERYNKLHPLRPLESFNSEIKPGQ